MTTALWVIPVTVLAAATGHLLTRWKHLMPRDPGNRAEPEGMAGKPDLTPVSQDASEPTEPSDPVITPQAREDLEQLCRGARVQELSVLVTTSRPRSGPGEDPHILVDFEPGTFVDYPAFLRLQHGLSTLVGRKVVLVARGRLNPNVRIEPRAVARVLYAV